MAYVYPNPRGDAKLLNHYGFIDNSLYMVYNIKQMKLTLQERARMQALEKERQAREDREIHSLVEQIAALYVDGDGAEAIIYGALEKCPSWKSASRLSRLLESERKVHALRLRNNIRRHSDLLRNVFEEPDRPQGHSLGAPAYQAERYYTGR